MLAVHIESYTTVPSSDVPLSHVYLSACDSPEVLAHNLYSRSDSSLRSTSHTSTYVSVPPSNTFAHTSPPLSNKSAPTHDTSASDTATLSDTSSASELLHIQPYESIFAAQKKKYKPVTQKVRLILAELPERFRIIHNITGNPLANMPALDPNPPPFQPTSHYTEDRCEALHKVHSEEFLQPAGTRFDGRFHVQTASRFCME
jgi:hypothetical protein